MPIQTNESNTAEITVDASGRTLTDVALPTVDARGRTVQKSELENKTTTDPKVVETTSDEVPKNADAETRKLFLQAQKAERKAKEMEKKAAEGLKKAEAFEAAREAAASGKDPLGILKAANIDPIKFYQDMTTFALKNPEKPEDPTQKSLREHEERLDQYKKDLEVQTKTAQDKEDLASHNSIISGQVIPLITNNSEKYECLLLEYGPNAAIQVYQQVWEHYQKTGETVSFESAADALENYWFEQITSGYNSASKLKKFQSLLNQQNSNTQKLNPEPSETPRRSGFTLSQKQSISASPPSEPYNRYSSREERAAQILKKFGG